MDLLVLTWQIDIHESPCSSLEMSTTDIIVSDFEPLSACAVLDCHHQMKENLDSFQRGHSGEKLRSGKSSLNIAMLLGLELPRAKSRADLVFSWL